MMVRGDPMNRGNEMVPGSLSTLNSLLDGFELASDAPESERRLALALWIASDENALTARVIVNRVWMHHFGRPLVRNPSDFGLNGGQPSHPGCSTGWQIGWSALTSGGSSLFTGKS